ncbi:hypothetical protein [Aliiglaciecola sp. LCG003]|uniref:hypothetical protein n=1 Tax=Aliiglaciecola sp. LCG003 TaxID=3053655 RepID=UPI0025740FB6|nr:hypothetical protein [Aliiglaciecola sp. LCG003]WJG11115.1 hypothetical protein QR722_08835 [Aliiglaciecola sp. LCG003]
MGVLALCTEASQASVAFYQGSVKLDMRLRYESVDQDNALEDAGALTLRTRLALVSRYVSGISAS